jgi:hypothetical protein
MSRPVRSGRKAFSMLRANFRRSNFCRGMDAAARPTRDPARAAHGPAGILRQALDRDRRGRQVRRNFDHAHGLLRQCEDVAACGKLTARISGFR